MLRDWLVVAALALLAASCGSGDDGDSASTAGTPTIIATTSIWADVASNVACDGLADVSTLVPIGGDPHGFEPSLSDRGEMGDATLVVANGLDLEEGLVDTIDAIEEAGVPVVRIAEGRVSGTDPHVWLDPTIVAAALPALADHLVDAGLDADAVDACVDAYTEELAALDEEIFAILADIPPDARKLVTSHDALGHFASRYGFEIVGTVIPVASGLAETSPAQLEELAQIIEVTGVAAIFAETQHSADDADALAERVGGIEVVALYTGSLGGTESGADSYIRMLRTNAELIASGLN